MTRITTLVALATLPLLRPVPAGADDKPQSRQTKPANAAFETLCGLVGTWERNGTDGKPHTIVFKITSHGSALVETMFPGEEHEMINIYTVDGDKLAFTHYCAMGNQPHMQLKSADKGVLQFEYVSGGNLTSRDEPHMDALQLTIAGDKLTEKWDMYSEGKVTGSETFEFTRKK